MSKRKQLSLTPPSPWTCGPVNRSGTAMYVHLIRAKGDPERRGAEKGEKRGWAKKAAQNQRLKGKAAKGNLRPSTAKKKILELLSDGTPRTFNRIGVEIWDRTADVLFDSPADRALWALASEGLVEFTTKAPILWRTKAA